MSRGSSCAGCFNVMIVELIIELLSNIISMYVLAPPKERDLSFGSRFHRGKKTPTKEE